MLRSAAARAIQRVGPSARRGAPLASTHWQEFHASVRREEEAKAVEPAETDSGWYTPAYGIAAGIAFAVPAIQYEWYLVNEETQLAACFIGFVGVVYSQFGSTIHASLEADGKQILSETNAVEDMMISNLSNSVEDLKSQQGLLTDMEALKELKAETYASLNETGKIKPLHAFKSQMEKMLAVIAAEEAALQEKAKTTLMEEATASVRGEFASSKDLKKKSLANAVALLKGSKTGADPVKDAYLAFFANKKTAAASVDEAAEIAESRASLITKMNSVAMTDKFYFEIDASGKPKMVA